MNGCPPPPADVVRSRSSAVVEKTVNAPRTTCVRVSVRVLRRMALAVLVVLTLASGAGAQESRVLLVYPDPPSALLGEALFMCAVNWGAWGFRCR